MAKKKSSEIGGPAAESASQLIIPHSHARAVQPATGANQQTEKRRSSELSGIGIPPDCFNLFHDISNNPEDFRRPDPARSAASVRSSTLPTAVSERHLSASQSKPKGGLASLFGRRGQRASSRKLNAESSFSSETSEADDKQRHRRQLDAATTAAVKMTSVVNNAQQQAVQQNVIRDVTSSDTDHQDHGTRGKYRRGNDKKSKGREENLPTEDSIVEKTEKTRSLSRRRRRMADPGQQLPINGNSAGMESRGTEAMKSVGVSQEKSIVKYPRYSTQALHMKLWSSRFTLNDGGHSALEQTTSKSVEHLTLRSRAKSAELIDMIHDSKDVAGNMTKKTDDVRGKLPTKPDRPTSLLDVGRGFAGGHYSTMSRLAGDVAPEMQMTHPVSQTQLLQKATTASRSTETDDENTKHRSSQASQDKHKKRAKKQQITLIRRRKRDTTEEMTEVRQPKSKDANHQFHVEADVAGVTRRPSKTPQPKKQQQRHSLPAAELDPNIRSRSAGMPGRRQGVMSLVENNASNSFYDLENLAQEAAMTDAMARNPAVETACQTATTTSTKTVKITITGNRNPQPLPSDQYDHLHEKSERENCDKNDFNGSQPGSASAGSKVCCSLPDLETSGSCDQSERKMSRQSDDADGRYSDESSKARGDDENKYYANWDRIENSNAQKHPENADNSPQTEGIESSSHTAYAYSAAVDMDSSSEDTSVTSLDSSVISNDSQQLQQQQQRRRTFRSICQVELEDINTETKANQKQPRTSSVTEADTRRSRAVSTSSDDVSELFLYQLRGPHADQNDEDDSADSRRRRDVISATPVSSVVSCCSDEQPADVTTAFDGDRRLSTESNCSAAEDEVDEETLSRELPRVDAARISWATVHDLSSALNQDSGVFSERGNRSPRDQSDSVFGGLKRTKSLQRSAAIQPLDDDARAGKFRADTYRRRMSAVRSYESDSGDISDHEILQVALKTRSPDRATSDTISRVESTPSAASSEPHSPSVTIHQFAEVISYFSHPGRLNDAVQSLPPIAGSWSWDSVELTARRDKSGDTEQTRKVTHIKDVTSYAEVRTEQPTDKLEYVQHSYRARRCWAGSRPTSMTSSRYMYSSVGGSRYPAGIQSSSSYLSARSTGYRDKYVTTRYYSYPSRHYDSISTPSWTRDRLSDVIDHGCRCRNDVMVNRQGCRHGNRQLDLGRNTLSECMTGIVLGMFVVVLMAKFEALV